MISKQAETNYINRKLRDSDKAKRFSEKAIDAKLKKLGAHFYTKPRLNQKVGFLLGVKYSKYLPLFDMGTGKTKLSLDLFNHFKRTKHIKSCLVLVPNICNVGEWQDETKLHAPNLNIIGLDGNKEEREQLLKEDYDVYAVTYAGLLHLTCKKVELDKKNKMVSDINKIKFFINKFDMIVFDESTHIKNHRSLSYKVGYEIAKKLQYKFCLTGTPHGRDVQDLWSQFKIIDNGETLGSTLGLFRAIFFTQNKNYWGGYEYNFKKHRTELLYRTLKHYSIHYSTEECMDLPERVYVKIPIIFSDEIFEYYEKYIELIQEAHGNYQILENAFINMRQLTSGYRTLKDEDNKKEYIIFKEQPKIDLIIEKINEVPKSSKIVIFNIYKQSGKILCEALKKNKIKYTRLYSATKKKKEVIRDFKKNDSIKVLVSSESGAYGLNLQIANYVFFFESPSSPIVRKQMEKRCHRFGQKKKVFIYDFYVKNSVDEKILTYLKEGLDLYKAIIRGEMI